VESERTARRARARAAQRRERQGGKAPETEPAEAAAPPPPTEPAGAEAAAAEPVTPAPADPTSTPEPEAPAACPRGLQPRRPSPRPCRGRARHRYELVHREGRSKRLRQLTGVGMLDAKAGALEANGGRGLAGRAHGGRRAVAPSARALLAAKRADRDASEGAVAAVRDGAGAALVELRCETANFVAKTPEFVDLVDEIRRAGGRGGRVGRRQVRRSDHEARHDAEGERVARPVVRLTRTRIRSFDTYLHQQSGRGVNAVAIVARRRDRAARP